MNDLASKSLLVTGATDGLGRGIAHALAERGATILVHGRDRARADRIAAELRMRGARAVRRFARRCSSWCR